MGHRGLRAAVQGILLTAGLSICWPGAALAQTAADKAPAEASWWRAADAVDYAVIAGSLGGFALLHAQPPDRKSTRLNSSH